MRTSRSTRLRDMSPRVRPDMSPAKQTRATHITRYTQNIVSQHGTSFAAMATLVLIDRKNTCNRSMRVRTRCLDRENVGKIRTRDVLVMSIVGFEEVMYSSVSKE